MQTKKKEIKEMEEKEGETKHSYPSGVFRLVSDRNPLIHPK